MSILVVVAHPDDEVLGAGATINKFSKLGQKVSVCIMSGRAQARTLRPSDEELEFDTNECLKLLGVKQLFMGDFPNIQMNTVPHLEMVQFIERTIIESKADIVITHHPADLNNDHLQTSIACQAAVRLFQRRQDVEPIREFLFMEIPSATEWGLNSSANPFRPNTYIQVGLEGVNKKIEALSQYKGVMRAYPHPRSDEAIRGLAAYRGGQSGCDYAEAFESVFRRIV